jgi:carboxyl-terminal processing protease
MKNLRYLSVLLLFLVFFSSCKDNDIPGETLLVNKWVQDQMKVYYLWNEQMPKLNAGSFNDPQEYFKRLLYKDDRFSWITPDAQSLKNQMDGNELSMGFSPMFRRLADTDRVFIFVEYVYKNSPAYQAGLKRGDIIASINDVDLNVNNYRTLYRQNAYTVTLGEISSERKLEKTNRKFSMTAAMIEKDPILHHEIIDYKDNKIGYLAYGEFISGDDNRWLNKLKNALNEIKNSGATELIVDLRYNPGGQMRMAGVLASAIAPKQVSEDRSVLVKLVYNKIVSDYLIKNQGADSENLVYNFPETDLNLGLSRVVFLTGMGSASASELLINGLDPYMDVIQIGEQTVGKCYGSIVMTDDETPPRHSYAMMPLVMKYENANGFTDFFDGLVPDYIIQDDIFNAVPFGDLEDPMLSAAVRFLNNEEMPARVRPTYSPHEYIPDMDRLKRGNILFPEGIGY